MSLLKRKAYKKYLFFLVISFFCNPLLAQESDQSIVRRIDNTTYKIGEVIMDARDRSIRIPAQINMTEGLLEVLLCTPRGKTHESLLATECSPTHLQVALITLGFSPIQDSDSAETAMRPDGFLVFIEWTKDGQKISYRAEDLVFNDATKKTMQHTLWQFVGSPVDSEGQLTAELDQTLIATYSMPTILENGLQTRFDDTLYYVNKKLVPPKGTEVTLIIKPYKIN